MTTHPAPLRVHVLIDSLTWGGAESLLADLAVGAPAADIELSVGYLQDVDDSPMAPRLRERGVEPQLVGVQRLRDLTVLRRLRRQLRATQPHVVHTHLGSSDLLGTIAARSLGLPAVSTIHLVLRRDAGLPPRERVKERLMALARQRGGARVIAVSDAARAAYLETGWDTPRHVVTVHNGIAVAPPRTGPAELRAQLGLAPDALVATMVTVLRPGKGHEVAVEVVRRLRERFPQLQLLIAGDGPALPDVRRLIEPLGEAALLLGHRTDVVELLGASDVLLHPTSMDAFPTVLLEAGAVGLPVLATAVGGIPEIVRDGETGLLVAAPPSADAVAPALERLLADAELRARLGAAARARFEADFTAERWAQRLRTVYDAVLSERAVSGRR
ncbi:MAG TPA: glycosyltransferase family 4 protein [Conexibacter sp.]|nr:glycosyltransferase family 4 protein [Conexibacter sp.]